MKKLVRHYRNFSGHIQNSPRPQFPCIRGLAGMLALLHCNPLCNSMPVPECGHAIPPGERALSRLAFAIAFEIAFAFAFAFSFSLLPRAPHGADRL